MATFIQKIAYKLDTSPRAKVIMLIFELSLGGLAFFVQVYPQNIYVEFGQYAFWGLLLIVIFLHVIIAYFGYAERLNILIYNEKKGLLYDKTRNIENVSLRRSTLAIIFSFFAKSKSYRQDVSEAGKECGKSFVNQFKSIETVSKENPKKSELLKDVLEYDSSSGMGKYTVESVETNSKGKLEIEIGILNPFVEKFDNSNKLCIFVISYLIAIVDEVHSPKKFRHYTHKNLHSTDDLGSLHILKLVEKS